MPDILHTLREEYKNELELFEKNFRGAMKSPVWLLDIIINYLFRTKGKQIRPLFVLLSAAMHGPVNKRTITAACMIELLHTATLVHDDIVDNSPIRRGMFSVKALWKPKIAVLTGDYLLSRGLLTALETKEYDLLHTVSDAVREMSEGEILQQEKSRKASITEEEYFDIIRKKTATLIAACTACGTQSVTAEPEIIKRMKLFGEWAGIAFQLRDDLFDYETKNHSGKTTANDIIDKKITLPVIYALRQATSEQKREIKRLVNLHSKKSDDIVALRTLVTSLGGTRYLRSKMEECRQNALAILDTFPPTKASAQLRDLVNYIIEREK